MTRFDSLPERDEQRLSVGLGARVDDAAGALSLELEWRPAWAEARGPELTWDGGLVTTRLSRRLLPAGRPVDWRLGHDWEERDYVYPTPAIGAPRRDTRHVLGAGASTRLLGPVELTLDYLHVSSRSNLPGLTYGEDVVTLRLGASR